MIHYREKGKAKQCEQDEVVRPPWAGRVVVLDRMSRAVLIEKMTLEQSSEGAKGVSCAAVCGKSIQAEATTRANALRCIHAIFKKQ